MRKLYVCALLSAALAISARAAELKGVVIDPSQRPIAGAQVAAFNSLGVITQQITNDQGQFDLYVSPLYENVQLRVTAPGFQITTVGMGASAIQLRLAPQSESIRVTGEAVDVPSNQQGSSVSVVSSRDLRERNEPQAFDLLRELPGMVFAQSGPRGSVADLFVRGGESSYNLVQIDGISVNSFDYGGLFDFAHIPSSLVQEIDVVRGPQSALYGSYAIGSVVNFVTRSPEDGPAFDVLAEGGTHDEHRFAISGSGATVKGIGVAGSISSLNDNGPVPNSDYRNDDVFLSAQYRWHTQRLFGFGDFNSNAVGEPGPFGSDPLHDYPGFDLISREKNNTSTYGLHYQNELSDNLRFDLFSGFFLDNSLYRSPYGDSFNKDIRGYGEARGTYSFGSYVTLAGGYEFDREEVKNTYVADSSSRDFPLRRDDQGIYLELRVNVKRFYITAGAREEIFQTPFIPGNIYNFVPRPDFPARTVTRLNPKIAASYLLQPGTRIHASYGTGIRPPGASDLAFSNNPALAPERSESYDIGLDQRLLNDKLSVGATWFHNRYKDLIVSLGGSLSVLSQYYTDNVSNAKAEGAEVTATFRPVRWLSITGNYMWLESAVLSLNGGNGLVEQYYYLGQPLLRRPKQSGSMVGTFHYKRLDANLIGYFRGHDLDVEPSYGVFGGLFRNRGYQNVGLNLNWRVHGNLTAYANLRNALDERYEEIFGFPSPLLNVTAGLKWSLAAAR
ncbi:MAG TPA: TonB-dependent receptor [Bryobacteraceae bacterium]|nr:TonB-dependent receptor [Bryobacteraceae bacterium]